MQTIQSAIPIAGIVFIVLLVLAIIGVIIYVNIMRNQPSSTNLGILVNTGVFGFFIFSLFIYKILVENLKIIFIQISRNQKNLLIFSLILIVSELFPFRSYGSIFQTVNGSMFWYLISLASALSFVKIKSNN